MNELPESYDGLSAVELDALLAAIREEATAITALLEDASTAGDADLDRLEVLASAVDSVNAALAAHAALAQERAEKAAAAFARIAPAAPVEDVVEVEVEVTEAEIEEVVAEAEAIVEDAPVAVVAAAPAAITRMPSPKAVVAKAPKSNVAPKAGVAIVAAGGVPGLRAGQRTETLADFVKPALQRWASYQGVNHASDELFTLVAPTRDQRLVANGRNDQDVMEYAASQSRLKGANGAEGILAAGGWCAPAEQRYDICTLAELDGILDVPTISMPRGSISYFRQLDYSTVATAIAAGQFCYTNTELVAEPPVVKPCFEIPCATPVEASLDACGLCLRAGLLQQKAFPELIEAWLNLALIAHAHFLNARNIAQIVAGSGAVQNVAGSFGAISAFLDAVALKATDYRLDQGMAEDATLEIFTPFWVPAVLWTDHNRRQFGSEESFSKADLVAKLAEINVRVQFVKDYVDAPFAGGGAVTVWPAAIPFVLYAPGAWVRGAEDIIRVSTLVDSTLLQTNRVQLLFIETGTIMLPWCGPSINVSVAICPSGSTGGPIATPPGAITCPAP